MIEMFQQGETFREISSFARCMHGISDENFLSFFVSAFDIRTNFLRGGGTHG